MNTIPPFIQPLTATTGDPDYARLRANAMGEIIRLAGNGWTDHNVHDPGITALEAVCYALTEQLHLNRLPVATLLELLRGRNAVSKDFFPREKVLFNAPVTLKDWRKFLTDQEQVRNAWMLPVTTDYRPRLFLQNNVNNFNSGTPVNLKGIYNVLLEWERQVADEELNGSIMAFERTVNGQIYVADLIFPFTWDTTEAGFLPFRQQMNLLSITSPGQPGVVLVPQAGEPGVYFASLEIQYNVTEKVTVGVILRINTAITSDTERLAVEQAFAAELARTNGPVANYNNIIQKGWLSAIDIRRLLMKSRNLAEDFWQLKAVNIQEISVHCELELAPGANASSVAGFIFSELDRFISPVIRQLPYPDNGEHIDEIATGPFLQHGYLPDDALDHSPGRQLFLSDILRVMLEGEQQERHSDIIAIYNLSLSGYINNTQISTSEGDSLKLIDDITWLPRLNIFKSQIIIKQRGVVIPVDMKAVWNNFTLRKNSSSTFPAAPPVQTVMEEETVLPPLPHYYPVQYDFPAFYELSLQERTAVNSQLRGYLFFFEQLLSDQRNHLLHSMELLSVNNTQTETRFPANIREQLPFYTDYLETGYESTLQTNADDNHQRRSILLDHLIARLGEDFRYYANWHRLEKAVLTTAKYNFLQDLPVLAANRLRAFDYSAPSLMTVNTAGIQQKLVHLLQLPDKVTRRRWKNPAPSIIVEQRSFPPNPVTFIFEIEDAGGNLLLKTAELYPTEQEAKYAVTAAINWGSRLEQYRIQGSAGAFRLEVLNNEEDVIAISENLFATEALAATASRDIAAYLGTWLPSTEGLYLLEQILLRPQLYETPGLQDALLSIPIQQNNTIAPGFNEDMYSQQLLVVLPAAGKRFGDPAFREIATAVIQREMPAWLKTRVAWLDIFMMHDFETTYEFWVHTTSNDASTEGTIRLAKQQLISSVNAIHAWLASNL